MTIHHDKMAYGKLAASAEEMNEEDILEILNQLNEQPEEKEEENDISHTQKKE